MRFSSASNRFASIFVELELMMLDINPDNFLVDCRQDGQERIIEGVQIIDFENAAYLPKLAGNDNWRSPEAHFKGELNKPTDIFSFGNVVSP